MGRTALYRDPIPFYSARAEVQLDMDAVSLRMPDGRQRRYALDGCTAATLDGFVAARIDSRRERRFVRMLVLERAHERHVVITPPDRGAVAPNVVAIPEAPDEAAVVDVDAWNPLADWVMGGGRLAACAITDLARLAVIATSQFAVLIGEVAAQRALELRWAARGLMRIGTDLETALQPLIDAAKRSPRAAEALVSALAHAAGPAPHRRRR
ncbi:MAG: hypothetical protein H6Q90_5112 [Deltaproteobacteria bacterium]|nr:hypothetical protein [Deltaproteobacteria bacterium]